KDKRRRARALARDHGEPVFTFGADPGGVLELIIGLKRAQMRRTGQHDVFANPWTRQVLERLAQAKGEDFGLRFAVLRVAGKVIAAEVGLRSGEAYHLWIPVYDPDFARYSPGALMTLETLAALAADGVTMVDFGPVDEAYKRVFAEPGAAVWEGQLHAARGLSSGVWRTGERLFAPLPAVRSTWRSALRRLDRIAACEPTLNGQMGAAARTVAILSRRHPRKAVILGLAASLNLSLLVID
ncbi:MAG: GNAT family N-acetyltransferase, partial [Phenylobacterium sp.]|uniref:GNAT family N-acetyltransferase n=1 Tax=Phenylobacterium sp. TaxID=1871053 RepID=UPI002733779B